MTPRFAVLALLAALSALPADSSHGAPPPVLSGEGAPIIVTATETDYARVVERAVDGYVFPAYAALAAATKALAGAARARCGDAGPGAADAFAAAFRNVLAAWAGVDFLRFGPITRDGRYERFAFWPDVHGTGARQLRQFLASRDARLLAPGGLAGQSAAVQGLPALEQLLYAGTDPLAKAGAADPFGCGLAAALAANLDDIAGAALADWRAPDGWAALLAGPGAQNPVYRSHAEAMTEVLKAILTALEQSRDQRLVPALGASPAEAKASRAPYARSGQTLAYLSAGAGALSRFVEVSGILDLLPDDQKGYGASVGFEFANLDRALAAAGPDLAAALADREGRSRLVYAAIVMQSLRDLFQRHVAVAAGLTAGFNSMDGD